MPAAWEYEQAVNNVSNWFNTSADNVWANINQYNLTPEQVQGILPTVDTFLYGQGANSGYTAVKAADGSIMSWNNVAQLQGNSANAVEQAINSNAGAISQKIYQLPASTDYSGSGGAFKGIKGLLNTPVNKPTIMSQVSTGVAAAGLGITLGKVIDKGLYYVLPYFFDDIDVTHLDPNTWNSITADMSDSGWEGTLKRAFNAIFGLDPNTGKSQMYLDADAAAYLAMYLNEKGVFSTGDTTHTVPADDPIHNASPYRTYTSDGVKTGAGTYIRSYNQEIVTMNVLSSTSPVYFGFVNDERNYYAGTLCSLAPFTYNNSRNQGSTYNSIQASVAGKTVYIGDIGSVLPAEITNPAKTTVSSNGTPVNSMSAVYYWAYIVLYGTAHSGGGVGGITDQDGATKPDFTGCETPADYKQALQQQYPDLFQKAITQNVAQPDGTVKQKTYIPVGTPTATGTQDTQPVTNPDNAGQSQSQTEVDPQSAAQTIIETIVKYIENTRTPDTPDTPNPPDTGDGNTPPVVVPTGSASALWSVYNPTQAQLNSFGAWLWSSNFIDQILKLFNNPMQSIIGVHKIFAQPAISGSGNIVVGYLDSGVASNIVGAQYTTVDCGTVRVREQFGNVFDYNDTDVRLYLPFIGIVPLDVMDVMRGSVNVVYHVDVITGACLAEVKVTRDGSGGTLYQFAGDAAVRYPISSGSYMGVVSGVLGVVGGIASGIMSGGATLPMAAGAIASGMSHAKTQVQHSGSFAGNAGAMGGKKPYLIIERPQTAIANGYGAYQGTGANNIVSVGAMSGYFKMTDVHLDGIARATESELSEIENLLLKGVIT